MRLRLALLAALLTAAGCDDQSMAVQKKYRTLGRAGLWPDGAAARPLPPGAVAQGALARDAAAHTPPPVTQTLVERGRERYDIFCSPCHGLGGAGDGMVVQRGFPKPPSYLSDRLLAAPGQHFFDVITHGYGAMHPFAVRVAPEDRWAIVSYIRALQMAGRAPPP